jgi:hypothetical protein
MVHREKVADSHAASDASTAAFHVIAKETDSQGLRHEC